MSYPLNCDECQREVEKETYNSNSGLCDSCDSLMFSDRK